MNTLAHAKPNPLAGDVRFTEDMLCVLLLDGWVFICPAWLTVSL